MPDTNKLASEKSPYLLQHADNPVDWYPWGKEAFQKAKKEDKPIFLSIGYATCHWCHVMAHESFEDEQIASLMNEAFVNIKVDREERPDIDNTYMTVCQMLTGSGGWPLTIFMTPEKEPFYAATYIPKSGRYGRPGMRELIPRLKGLWEDDRQKIYDSADEIVQAFRKSTEQESGEGLTEEIFDKAFNQYKSSYDSNHGGLGTAPKFPSPHNLMFLLRHWKHTGNREALTMVEKTLTGMRQGGIYDQVGFGFHRYSTDARWLVPHFEKMLYDQAMLIMAYTEGWQATSNDLFKQTVAETVEYLSRDMADPGGAFYSAEDADSEGEEGKFYIWSVEEIRHILPAADAELAIEVFNMAEEGNYADEATGRQTGKNILHFDKSISELAGERDMAEGKMRTKIEQIRKKLLEVRKGRVRPLLDDKILTDWNGMAIAALAKAGRVFENKKYIEMARRAYSFIQEHLLKDDDTLWHRYREGESAIEGHADDYAFLIWGLLELYESTFDIDFLEQAISLNKTLIDRFWDPEEGGYYFTGEGSEELLGRTKQVYDGAIPSGNSVALSNLIRLGRITADDGLENKADALIRLFSSQVSSAPTGFGQFLQGVNFALLTSHEVVIAGERKDPQTRRLLAALNRHFIPNMVRVLNEPHSGKIEEIAPYTAGQGPREGKPTAYVCQNYSCNVPTHDPEQMLEQLNSP